MSWATCCDCGFHFDRAADESWKTRCIPCFKKFKRAESVEADSYWPDRARAAESLAATLKRQLEQRPVDSFGKELAENWRALVQLVHPDKHNGSQGATRLTQWLNDIKPRLPCV